MSLSSRLLLSFTPLFMAVGSFIADFNDTHVYNPRWPPHARFHNGQTMSMGAGLCLASFYFTWRLPYLHGTAAKKEALAAIWFLGVLYCITGLSGILYPGSSGVDPEFFQEHVGEYPQKLFALPMVLHTFVVWNEWRKLSTPSAKTRMA